MSRFDVFGLVKRYGHVNDDEWFDGSDNQIGVKLFYVETAGL